MKNVYYLLTVFCVILSSCNDIPVITAPEMNSNVTTRANGNLTLYMPSSIAEMGDSYEPTLTFSGDVSFDTTSGTVYLFCRLGSSPDVSFDGRTYELKNNTFCSNSFDMTKNQSDGFDIQTHKEYFCVPGEWRYQAIAFIDGETYESDIVEVEVRFPYVGAIESDGTVMSAMSNLWSETLNAASEESRQEKGFWIYAHVNDGGTVSYTIGETEDGPSITDCGTQASISPSSPNATAPTDVSSTNVEYYVAYFHTHTTLHYCPSDKSRDTGPSGNDDSYASQYQVPVLLYDYSDFTIYGGGNLYAAAKLYRAGDIDRCKTPTVWFAR